MDLCFSNNAIEQFSNKMCVEIINTTIYRPVKADLIGGKVLDLQEPSTFMGNKQNLINCVTLSDKDGNSYTIEPNENGLKFARGEISYQEYIHLKTKSHRTFILFFLFITAVFFSSCWFLVKLLLQ